MTRVTVLLNVVVVIAISYLDPTRFHSAMTELGLTKKPETENPGFGLIVTMHSRLPRCSLGK